MRLTLKRNEDVLAVLEDESIPEIGHKMVLSGKKYVVKDIEHVLQEDTPGYYYIKGVNIILL